MLQFRQASLVSQISLSCGIALCLCLLLTLPLLGWWAGSLPVKQTSPAVQVDTGRIDDLLRLEQARDIGDARRSGDTVHRELTASLLLHEDMVEIGEQELPLITFRGKPVHQASDALKTLLQASQSTDATLMLFARTEDGFELAAHSAWPNTGSSDFGQGMSPALSERLELPPGQADTRYVSIADESVVAYLRPLRNSAGEVKAALVMTRSESPLLASLGLLRSQLTAATKPVKTQPSGQGPLMAAVGLAAALLISLLMYFVMRLYARQQLGPLKDLTATALKMSTGDLSVRAKTPDTGSASATTRNEIALLARGINRMAEQTGQLVDTLRRDTGSVVNAASQLSESARQINDGSQRETQAATGMAAAIEEMTTSIASVGQNAEEARGISQRAHELVAEGSAAVASATEQMQTISETVQTTAQVIAQLGDQSRQISAIAAMIREIAEQTNLLALNAAIEAARAGENGRGFSVVADEVRRLAERTSDSTEQIRGMIDAIQDSANVAVHNMETAVSSVQGGVQLVSHVGETISRIHEDASHVANAVDAINVALREQNAASNSIAQQVDCVAQMSGNTHHTAATAVSAAQDMQETARRMMDALKTFSKA